MPRGAGAALALAAALAACSPAPDAVQDRDGVTLPDATAARLDGIQDFARARADAVEVDAQLAVQVERLADAVARAGACGESTADAEQALGAALDAANLDSADRATMEALSDAVVAKGEADPRQADGCR